MEIYLSVLKKYTEFTGRAARKEYWMFALVNFIVSIIISWFSDLLGFIYALVVLLPSVGVMIRRLHDTDRSGWWSLLVFLPIVGWIVLIIFLATDTKAGANKYGPSPKEAPVVAAQ